MNTSTNHSADFSEGSPIGEHTSALVGNIFVAWNVLEKLFVVLSNGLTMVILCKYARLETPSNVFIAGLTLADLFSAAALPFTIASVYLPAGLWWNLSCAVHLFIATATSFLNSTLLLVIAIDRLLYIVYSLRYHLVVTVKKAIVVVCALWSLGTAFTLTCTIVGFRNVYVEGSLSGSCIPYLTLDRKMRTIAGVPYFICIPLTIMCYIKIGLIARKQKRAIAAHLGPVQSNNQPTAPDFKITKVMVNVLVIYFICNSMIILQAISMNVLKGPQLELAFRLMIIIKRINTWVNPIIYVWKSKRFRRHIKNFLGNNQGGSNSIF